jgi:hypothetical protein
LNDYNRRDLIGIGKLSVIDVFASFLLLCNRNFIAYCD